MTTVTRRLSAWLPSIHPFALGGILDESTLRLRFDLPPTAGISKLRGAGEAGDVVGAKVSDSEWVVEVRTSKTLLITGGFQGSSALMNEHFGDYGRDVLLGSNAYSTGEGLRWHRQSSQPRPGHTKRSTNASSPGRCRGSRVESSRDSRWRSAFTASSSTRRARASWTNRGVTIANAQAAATQLDGKVAVLFDHELRSTWGRQAIVTGPEQYDKIDEAGREGAHVARAESWGGAVRRTS